MFTAMTILMFGGLAGTWVPDAHASWAHADVMRAIEQVESGGDAGAVGDRGLAVGILQIHPVMVDECNRIVGSEKWRYEDRLNVTKSREMFRTYVEHHCRGATDEQIARRWNGGPRGDRRISTFRYWRKVQAEMKRQKRGEQP